MDIFGRGHYSAYYTSHALEGKIFEKFSGTDSELCYKISHTHAHAHHTYTHSYTHTLTDAHAHHIHSHTPYTPHTYTHTTHSHAHTHRCSCTPPTLHTHRNTDHIITLLFLDTLVNEFLLACPQVYTYTS